MTGLLRGEERREDVLGHNVGQSRPGIGDAKVHLPVEPGGHDDAARPAGRVLGHRLSRVGDEVEHDLLQAVAVAQHVGEHTRQITAYPDVLELQVVVHQQQRAPDHVVQVDRRALGRSLAGEGEEVAHDAPRPLGLLLDHFEVPAIALPQLLLLEQELREARDRGERVVELVGDARNQLSDRGEFLALDQLGLHRLLVRHVLDEHDDTLLG